MRTLSISGRGIGAGHPTYIVAEAGINHNGDIALAKRLVIAARDCGADAVKFQSFQAEKICDTALTETKEVEGITGGSNSSYEMYRKLELSDGDHRVLMETCRDAGITFLSSVFDEERVAFLDGLGMPAFKISSGDITHLPLIRVAAKTGRPVLLSTGMSTLDEVASAVRWCRDAGNEEVVLLHCSCLYPPPDDEVNLNAMVTMRESFAVPVGYSDHTDGVAVPLAAVSMGANIVEKHFTLDRGMPGPDHHLSLDPEGFARMVDGIRKIERARGSYRKEPSPGEMAGLVDGRRSIMAAVDIPAGTVLTRAMLKALKPAKGLPPSCTEAVVGKIAGRRIARNEPLTNEMLQEKEELWEQAVFARG